MCVCLFNCQLKGTFVFDVAMAGCRSGERAADHRNLHAQERVYLCRDDVPEPGTRSHAGLCHPVQQEQVRKTTTTSRERGRETTKLPVLATSSTCSTTVYIKCWDPSRQKQVVIKSGDHCTWLLVSSVHNIARMMPLESSWYNFCC